MWLKEWLKERGATTDKRVFRCYIPYQSRQARKLQLTNIFTQES